MSEIRILAIEDNVADIHVLRYALDCCGEEYILEVLKDGEEALRFVQEHRAGERQPDPCVIILDLHLPKYNGLELLRAIAETPPLIHIHVVVLSSFVSPPEEREIVELGAIYKIKPASVQEYIHLAAEIIELCKTPPLAALA
jgi:CheY-like chemotaxis protein